MSAVELQEQLQEASLPNVILKLYRLGEIDVAGWRCEMQDIIVPVGEFDLSYCLSEMPEKLVQLQAIEIHKLDDVITLSDGAEVSIKMNDFEIEVRK
jgi:hypothetical protein